MSEITIKPEWLTVNQTASRLGLHPITVRRKIDRGELPAIQLGGRGSSIRIPVDELERWMYEEGTP